jgi:hypothetical protein
MARYNSRSRRRRRPRYRRRGGNNIRLYIVLTVALCATIYLVIRWQGGQAADPNDVNGVGGESVTDMGFQQPNVPDLTRTDIPEPKTNQLIVPQPEIQGDPAPAVSPVIVEANPEVETMIAASMALLAQDPEGKLIAVRDRLNTILSQPMGTRQRALIKGQLADLAQKWLFSNRVYPGDTLCEIYKVEPGDMLQDIGRRFKVPYKLLMDINSIRRAQDLQAGALIKIVNGPFHTSVKRSAFAMDLYLQDKTYVRSYAVGLGLSGRDTPTGLWIVRNDDKGKMEKPEWTDPDTKRRYYPGDFDYPLGPRWIGLRGIEGEAVGRTGFAIHGTNEPSTIGTNASRGCIRLLNDHVIEVYNMMYPGFSKVTVEN